MNALRSRVVARDIDEAHRKTTPLELLFDLTFVVAVASVVRQLTHARTGISDFAQLRHRAR